MLSRAPQSVVRNWIMDSRQWAGYQPRDGDVIIATAPKVGTTWTQQIVSLLVFQSPEPHPLWDLSPWIDARFQMPIEVSLPMIEAQTHRRFLKSHLPLDALPIYDEVKYIHVARDGRDACMSFLNHFNSVLPAMWEQLDAIGIADDAIGMPYFRPPKSAREFFLYWMADDYSKISMMSKAFFHLERSFWQERKRPNLLMVHYNDLKADLSGEMKRIADFIGIETPEDLWPQLVEAATFDSMKRNGGAIMAGLERAFKNGHETFLHSGTNNRWKGVLTEDDLANYEARVKAELSPALNRWLKEGRLSAGDPGSAPD
ncbi:MAG: sulfotransferase domain-containing protein [Candidatus Binatus sp.]|uniref:sulfotransferase domain-containing protein n=1 Tax=Candidatus Binatus sp. TaxID=2811406 RepID=UPI002724D762|nr:sulfotransferase domain-containing protein [Candidatus Binatus sp.]MDO8433753.1 sulfotransferase domain-containing protein [Candidatus Binatus sp.]